MQARVDPLVIGAVGGSGTRVFSRIARRAGVFMGEHVDAQEDSVPVSRFYGEFASEYLAADGRLDSRRRAELSQRLAELVAEHLDGLSGPDQPWGVKNPRSLLMLPFWHERFVQMRFLHVVRSGLDMAYSATDNQIRRHGEAVLGTGMSLPRPERAMLWWSRVNTAAADYGEANLGRRYLRVRLEDLCERPEETVRRLFEFIGAEGGTAEAVAEVVPPATLGRWRQRPADEIARLVSVGGEALGRFGYRCADPG
ncbi:MAG: sulfotransferase [Solirubrobacteraceae bacterium]